MRDLMRYSPYYMGALAVGVFIAALLGIYPSVIVLGVIIVLSFTIVLMVMRVGTHDDEPLAEPSKSLAFWNSLADKVEARQRGTLPAGNVTAVVSTAASDDAEKERKRQEALARKAARQAKSTGGEA